MTVVQIPAGDAIAEGRRVGEAAIAAGLELKLTGGVAVALRCPSAARDPLARACADVDLVGRSKRSGEIIGFLTELGYVPDEAFNAVNGRSRLFFMDQTNGRQLDVFLDEVEMCHRIDLRDRLETGSPTLSLADLLLMKLQVMETNHKDYQDILALLVDHPFTEDDAGINLAYLAALASADWGIWRTTTLVAERAADVAARLDRYENRDIVRAQVQTYVEALERAPKSRKWTMRARLGERKRWYELPEESH
jgi:hypothetical protein